VSVKRHKELPVRNVRCRELSRAAPMGKMSRSPVRDKFSAGGERGEPVHYERISNYPGSSPQFAIWLLVTCILLIPSSLAIHLSGEGFKFTPGRAAIALLFVPALVKFMRRGPRLLAADFLMFSASAWMIGSRVQEEGLNASAIAEVVELFGGYVVARGYFFDSRALHGFIQRFKAVLVVIVILASLDLLARMNVATAITSSLFHTPYFAPQYRYGLVRAQSTIEDAELYGTLCCVAGSLFLYVENNALRRIYWVGFSFFGCGLALSSGPLLAFVLMVAAFVYDRFLARFSWRWRVCAVGLSGAVLILYLSAAHPTSWLISHLTLDPSTGYFRVYAFDYAFDQISVKPVTGWGFDRTGGDDFEVGVSIDNVWLVVALRFGIPASILLLLTNICTFFPLPERSKKDKSRHFIKEAGTAFTSSIMCFVFIGLTVHYWNALWMLWAIFLGIRASLKEGQLSMARQSSLTPRYRPAPSPTENSAVKTGAIPSSS
jgi:hypothetical protein